MQELRRAIDAITDHLVAIRHDIHRHPEPGFEEQRTQSLVRRELESLGLTPSDCAGTGLVADLGGDGDGRTVALRADLDALRMTEENPHLDYRSPRDGVAHMCGHDGHTTMLLGAAHLLAPVADRLPGRVRLLFQPAEEGPGGAAPMIEEGALEGVDEVYGLHNWPVAPLGTLRVVPGPFMAHVATFRIRVHGKGGHASQPHHAIDPVLAAAHVITALQSIASRNVAHDRSAVVTVTMVHGGEVENVIPDHVDLTGTIRVLDDETSELIDRRMRALCDQTAAAFGARAEVEIDHMYPVLVNHEAETEHVRRVGRAVLGPDAVTNDEVPLLGGEDFAYFTRERPGCYFLLGGGEPGRTNSMCHSTDFDFNDHLIGRGVELWVRLVEDRLGAKLFS